MIETKMNSIADFIASAKYLVEKKYTSPQRLGALGWSAGAIVIGRALTVEPGLFSAAAIEVGLCNPVRLHVDTSGPANVPEFGDIKTEAGFRALLAMDPYHNVKDGTPYPAVLLTAGINDARGPAWQPAKLAARLQVASTSGRPTLLRVGWDEGHGMASTRTQRARVVSDQYASRGAAPRSRPPRSCARAGR